MDLNQKLTAFRDEEVEKRSRAATLATKAETEDLSTDDKAEIVEIEERLTFLTDAQMNIKRLLSIGEFHEDVNDPLGLNKKEQRDFSILKLLRAMDPRGSQKDRDDATLELEASAAIAKRDGASPKGAFLPMEIMGEWHGKERHQRQLQAFEQRDLQADTFTQAGALVGVDFRPDQMIALLRNNMAVTDAGATFLDGLVGDVAIPRQTGAGSVGWVGRDGGTISETNQAVDQVTLTPRTVGCYTDISRQLRQQSSVSAEGFVRNDLSAIVAIEKDRAALHGSGTSGEPTGIENVTGVLTESFSTASGPTRNEVINMITDLSTGNALQGNLAFITGSAVYGNLMKEPVDAGSGLFLVQDTGGSLVGERLIKSNQVTAGQMYFGNWADLLIGTWGGIDIMVDPFTGATAGTLRVLIFHSCDITARHPESFTLGS